MISIRFPLRAAWGLALAMMLPVSASHAAESENTLPTLSPRQINEGWKILFDGKTTHGWRGFKKEGFPTQGWKVHDHCLVHAAKGGGGDLVTEETYEQFDLRWDWKVAPGANSGVKYFILEERGAAIGHEYQMIDDEQHSDAKTGPLHQTAAFYDVLPPTVKATRPAGQWNESRILVKGSTVQHWLNGKLVLTYTLGSPEVKEGIAKSKFKAVQGFGDRVPGRILLQDHGDEVWFRNIKIHPLR